METLIAQLINGLAIGSIYALVVVGLNLLLLVRGIIQFSYPHIVVLSMYVLWIVLGLTGDNLALGILAAILTCTLLSTLTEPIFRPLVARGNVLETMVAALGIAIIITEIMSHFLHHGRPVSFPVTLTGGGAMMKYGVITLSLGNIYTLVGCIAVVVVLLYLLYHSKLGRAFRAIAQDLGVARLVGVPITKTSIYSFAIAGVLGGITAVLLAMTLGSASAGLGDRLLFIALALLMFAGMGNLKGGLICGFLLGLAMSMSMAYLPGRWTDAVVFGIIMITIIVRPYGLFGTRAIIRF